MNISIAEKRRSKGRDDACHLKRGDEAPHIAGRGISCSVNQAVERSSLSRRSIYRYINQGLLKTTKLGGRRLVLLDSLEALVREGGHA